MIFGPQFIHISSSSSSGGTGAAVSYDSFSIPSGTNNTGWYVVEFNSKLYSYGTTDSEVHESSDGGNTWSFKYHMQYNLNNIIPVVENNRVLYIDGGGSNNVLKSWDGSSNSGTTISTGLTSGQIEYFGKVDGYYYYSNFAGPLYRTSDTTLTSGWSQVSGIATANEIMESGGTIIAVHPIYGIRRTATDWSTGSSPSINVGAPWSIATDGNGNWITGSQGGSAYSTDDGVTWAYNYNMHSAESGTGANTNSFILSNSIKFIGDKFFWINAWDDELVSNADPFQDHISTNTNSRVYQFPGEAIYMSLVGNDKMFVSGQDANGTWGIYKFNITGLPAQSQTVSASDAVPTFGNRTDSDINFQSNEHTTPAESKRLWNLGNNQITSSLQFYPDTYTGVAGQTTLSSGVVLYGDTTFTTLAYDTSYYPREKRNTYAYYAINSGATNQYGQNPASIDYWVKIDTATSTIVHVYADADVTANTLKDVTSNLWQGGTIGTNGAFFFGDGNTSHTAYTGALNANISNQDYGYQLYVDSEDKYPKVGDRTYITATSQDSGIWGGGVGSWFPFLVEGTTSSDSVSYAIQLDYASYDGSNISTTSPGASNNLFITEIRDSNGNIVTQIT